MRYAFRCKKKVQSSKLFLGFKIPMFDYIKTYLRLLCLANNSNLGKNIAQKSVQLFDISLHIWIQYYQKKFSLEKKTFEMLLIQEVRYVQAFDCTWLHYSIKIIITIHVSILKDLLRSFLEVVHSKNIFDLSYFTVCHKNCVEMTMNCAFQYWKHNY